jgi:undecaprenyl-diphosphatase
VSIWQAALLGALQGLTEFLPISSSGHLILARHLWGLEGGGLTFEVAVHVGTLGSILTVLGGRAAAALREAWAWVRERGPASPQARLVPLVLIGTMPAAITGLAGGSWIEDHLATPGVGAVGLLFTGALLWSTGSSGVTRRARDSGRQLGPGLALAIGCAQAIAVVPGVSRSGATIGAALLVGVEPELAFVFSFLLAIPAVAGAAVYKLPDLAGGGATLGWPALAGGIVAAYATGVVAARLLLGVVRRGRLAAFAPYCWAVGGCGLIWAVLRGFV